MGDKMFGIFQPGGLGECNSLTGNEKTRQTTQDGQGLIFEHVKFKALKWNRIADIWKQQSALAEIVSLW